MSIQRQQIKLNSENDLQEFQEYLYERENAQATIRKYLTDMHTFFVFLAEDYVIDKKRVLEYKEWLCNNYAATSTNSMLVALNQFLDFVGASHMKVKRLKIQKKLFASEEREMSKAEYQRLVTAAIENDKGQLALAMETLAATGARISELTFFTVDRVKKGKVEIVNKGKRRVILLADTIRKKLLYYVSRNKIEQGCIFATRSGKPKDRSNFWREMRALKKDACVEEQKIFPHNLRHLFARLFYKKTRDLAGLADILGHSSLDVTRIYTANSEKLYRKQIEELGLLTV